VRRSRVWKVGLVSVGCLVVASPMERLCIDSYLG
jgi:hypothetical protein